MRTWFVLTLLALAFPVAPAFSIHCESSCEDQCRKGFLGNNVDPACYGACRTWQAARCFSLPDPYVTAMGAAGAVAYPAAASIMSQRNPGFEVFRNSDQKTILRRFYGDLVDRVRIHWNARMMDSWGSPPTEIDLGTSAAQTYGHDIYVAFKKEDADAVYLTSLLGHELKHVQQFEASGQSLERFGRNYFESFAAGGGYRNSAMEKEAYNTEPGIEKVASEYFKEKEAVAPWDLEVCNHSEAEKIFVAVAYDSTAETGGLALLPIFQSKGWFAVTKGSCLTVARNPDGSNPLYAFATTNTAGRNGFRWGGDSSFCINRADAFRIDRYSQCTKANEEQIGFQSIPNPHPYGSAKYTWRLTGAKPTEVRLCNNAPGPVGVALLHGDEGYWHGQGWYSYESGECKDYTFNGFQGPFYVYGETSGLVWASGPESGNPPFCIVKGAPFNFLYGTVCNLPNSSLVRGVKMDLVAGFNIFPFNPPPPPGLVHLAVDFGAYCAMKHGADSRGILHGKTAFEWSCIGENGVRNPINMSEVCQIQHGTPTAKYRNLQDATSWYCEKAG